MDQITRELQIPRKYLKSTIRSDKFISIAHKSWIKSLYKHGILSEFIECEHLAEWPLTNEQLGKTWLKICICIYRKKSAMVIPLPRPHSTSNVNETDLTFLQLLHYVMQTNHRNQWKEAYKKYVGENTPRENYLNLTDHNAILREIIIRAYGCPIINLHEPSESIRHSKHYQPHANLLQALCCIETSTSFYTLHVPHVEYTLQDCLTYSPAILDTCYTKPLFLVFQLLHVLRSMHDRGLTVGDISLHDIHIDQNLWIQLLPRLDSNLIVRNDFNGSRMSRMNKTRLVPECSKNIHNYENARCIHCGTKCYDKVQVADGCDLQQLCELWVQGSISNLTYLTSLNRLAGRRYGEPNCHYLVPWVTDFTSRCGNNWRDLTKSKFRLNKGDRQLDLTYESSLNNGQVPHHVSDVLSSITYYVYTARRTPRSVLCSNVRTVWVPAEYPSSIQRLQEWTPDECIPEFFTKPLVFKSIHEDLPDLEVPPWSSSPEDFIEKHREALESAYVSERLHHWIDLTFGYKLSGPAAIKSKNLILHLVDNHQTLSNTGIIQLFYFPHPPRQTVSSPWLARLPPKIHFISSKIKKRDFISNEQRTVDEDDASAPEEDASSPQQTSKSLILSRFLSRSRTSLTEDKSETVASPQTATKTSPISQHRLSPKSQKAPTFLSHIQPTANQQLLDAEKKASFQSYLQKSGYILPKSGTGTIFLPKEYNPVAQLTSVESFHNFESKTFHQCSKNREETIKEVFEEDSVLNNAFTNRIFADSYEEVYEEGVQKLSHKQAVASKRIRELQVLGCLIVEIFMSKQLRALALTVQLDFNARLKSCLGVIKSMDSLPLCIKYAVDLLLQTNIPEKDYFTHFRYPTVTEKGLPPPSAHQLLQPLLTTSIFQFSTHFWPVYKFLQTLQEFKHMINEHDVLTYFNCTGENCIKYEHLERNKIEMLRNINDCKVKICANELEQLLMKITAGEIIELILSQVVEILENPDTGVLGAWYLFDPIAKALGPRKSTEKLLPSIVKQYENDLCIDSRSMKLYHHSFLLRLIVRFGLKHFLEHFVTPLVEAVGGCRDFDTTDVSLHNHRPITVVRKTSNLKYVDESDQIDVLSPIDDDSTAEIVDTHDVASQEPDAEPEMFVFDKEDKISPNDSEDRLYNIINHILEPDDIETGVAASEDDIIRTCAMSPTIPIPSSSSRTELLTINCEIGSKKSFEGEEEHEVEVEEEEECVTNPLPPKEDFKISDISCDSLIWLAHRLGPVLTSKYLSRNLLRMLTLCYLGRENQQVDGNGVGDAVLTERVVGDASATRVLECLMSIAALYGEQLIILQYLPHITELIILCKRRLTPNLEGGLISCIVLLKHIIPYLSDETLSNNLHDNILRAVIIPSIRLVGTTRTVFPNGAVARSVLARKIADTMYLILRRSVMCGVGQEVFNAPLQRLFLIFDKCFGVQYDPELYRTDEQQSQLEESSFLEVRRDGSTAEWTVKDGRAHRVGTDAVHAESWSPPLVSSLIPESQGEPSLQNKALSELKQVFTNELAYQIYIPLVKYLGANYMETCLRNHMLIETLCFEYKQELKLNESLGAVNPSNSDQQEVGSFGSNVAMIGNRIEVIDTGDQYKDSHFLSHKMESTSRHLRGNWLAYWEHEIGRAEKDVKFNLKQIKLQTFVGHAGGVRTLHVLDNENSFMSGSRDKTVKLWSLRSCGDGTASAPPQWTYTAHKKSVLAVSFLESLRLAVSCDSAVHVWDPFMGVTVSVLDVSARNPPVSLVKPMPAPSSTLLAATIEGSIRFIDARLCSYSHEYKVSTGTGSVIRCLAISSNGYIIGVGHSTGILNLLDIRYGGKLLAMWKAHEGEILQLAIPDSNSLISSSLDQTVSLWSLTDGKFKFHLKGATEPVHCLCCYNNEVVAGTTANRIGVYSCINDDKTLTFSTNRLRSETFRGVLTSMSILPLNKLLLLGSDTGNISLLC